MLSLGTELTGPSPNPISLVNITVAGECNFTLLVIASLEDDSADQCS